MSRKHRFINKKTRSSTYKFETILCVDRGIFFYRIIELSGIINCYLQNCILLLVLLYHFSSSFLCHPHPLPSFCIPTLVIFIPSYVASSYSFVHRSFLSIPLRSFFLLLLFRNEHRRIKEE